MSLAHDMIVNLPQQLQASNASALYRVSSAIGFPASMANPWDMWLEATGSGWDYLFSSDESLDERDHPLDDELGPARVPGGQEPAEACTKPFHISDELTKQLTSSSSTLTCPFRTIFHQILCALGYPEKTNFEDVCQEVCKVVQFFLCQPTSLHISKEALGRLIQVRPARLAPHLALCCNTLGHLDRQHRYQLEESLANSSLELILYIEHSRYDETPMRVRHEQLQALSTPEAGAGRQPEQGMLPQGRAAGSLSLTSTATSVAKMMSTELQYGMLVKASRETEDGAEEQLFFFKGSTLAWNQVLARGNAACMVRALLETGAVSPGSEQFLWKTRVTTTDANSANILTEKLMSQQRGPSWTVWHIHCAVHKASRCLTKTLSLAGSDVTGFVNFSLSLSGGASMHDYRAALAAVITSRPLVIHRGSPPAEVAEHHAFVIKTFARSGSRQAEKVYLLQEVLTGNWNRTTVLEVYIPAGPVIAEADVGRAVLQACLAVLSHRTMVTFPRHRWLGADRALDQLSMAGCLHNLGFEAFLLMCRAKEEGRSPSSICEEEMAAASQEHGRWGLDLEAELAVDPHAEAGEAGEGGAQAPARMQGGAGDPDRAVEQTEEESWQGLAERNAQTRKKAAQWLQGKPLATLICLRLLLKPMFGLLSGYISKAGHKQEARQKLQQIKQKLGLETTDCGHGGIFGYVALEEETLFCERLTEVMESPDWQFLPEDSKTLRMESFAFRVSSRLAALVWHLLIAPTKFCPWKVLQLVEHPEVGAELDRLPDCMKDNFTTSFLQRFPAQEKHSREAIAALVAIGDSVKVETVQVEWGHGRVHRLIKASGVQTHVPEVGYINSQWVCQKFRARFTSRVAIAGKHGLRRKRISKRPAASPQARIAKKRSGFGGPLRAFMSMRSRGSTGRLNFGAAAAAFRQEKEANSAVYQEAVRLGKVATDRTKEGQSGFGENARQSRRAAARAKAREGDGEAGVPLPVARVVAQAGLEGQQDGLEMQLRVEEGVRQARAIERSKQRRQALLEASEADWLHKYQQEQSRPLGLAVPAFIPELTSFSGDFQAMEQDHFTLVEVQADHRPATAAVASFAVSEAQRSNLSSTVQADWRWKNRVIPAEELETAQPEGDVPEQEPPCLKRGFCTCTLQGKQLAKFCVAVLRAIKGVGPRDRPENRELLMQGHVVFSLTAEDKRPLETSAWDSFFDDVNEEEAQSSTAVSGRGRWLHISALYLSPYIPVLQELTFLETRVDGRIHLQQTGTFVYMWELLSHLDRERTWNVAFYQLVATRAPLDVIDPRRCLVEHLGSETVCVWQWPPAPRQRIVRHRPQAHAEAGLPPVGPAVEQAAPEQPLEAEDPADQGSILEGAGAMEDRLSVSSEEEGAHAEEDLEDMLQDMLDGMAPAAEQEDQPAPPSPQQAAPFAVEEGVVMEAAEMEAPHDAAAAPEAAEVYVPGMPAGSGAAPAAMLPPPPVALQPPGVAALPQYSGAREPAELVLQCPEGKITYYKQGYFTCVCSNVNHSRCVLTRTAQPGNKPGQGRPLGFMYSWLKLGVDVPDKATHWRVSGWPTLEQRRAARVELQQMPGAAALLSKERPLKPGEDPEPVLRP